MGSQESTRTLVAKAQHGDRAAFDELAGEFRARLLAFVCTRLGDRLRRRTEPEDIVQETFLKAYLALERFRWRGERSLFAWLATIAEYEIRQLGRSQQPNVFSLERDPPGAGPSPSGVFRREERKSRLDDALESLEPDHRTVIRLVRLEGMQTSEVARRMDRSTGAIRQLLLRALQKLRRRFGDYDRSARRTGVDTERSRRRAAAARPDVSRPPARGTRGD